jgi:Protein of unknown function (DUF3300)
MMRRPFALIAALALASVSFTAPADGQSRSSQIEYPEDYELYSADQLDDLVGAVALYPDALLAQVLIASTFPDQIDDAARFVRRNGTDGIDDQSWDVSVKAVAHYPSALNMLADKSEWTAALGRAYAMQSSDVMSSVQRMRGMAARQGNLQSTAQQQVSNDDGNYVIAPAQTRVIYVPVYDPYVVYRRPIFRSVFGVGFTTPFWSFGVGFPIGGWLSYDCNWRSRSVYYNGWDNAYNGYASGWRTRSRPYIQITNVYVHPRYRSVYYDRDIIRRRNVYRGMNRGHIIVQAPRGRDWDNRGWTDRNDRGRDERYDRDDRRDWNRSGNDTRAGYDGNRNDRNRDDRYRDDRNRDDRVNNNGNPNGNGYGNRNGAGNNDDRRGGNGRGEQGGGGGRDRSAPAETQRVSDDRPMINPRRAEPASTQSPAPSGNGAANDGRGGASGRGNGRGSRDAKELPKF